MILFIYTLNLSDYIVLQVDLILFFTNSYYLQGKGTLYSYDPVGHAERNMYRAGGSACTLLQPLLDNQVEYQIFYFEMHIYLLGLQLFCKNNIDFSICNNLTHDLNQSLCQVGLKNMVGVDKVPLSVEKAMNIIHDVFVSAAEREIHTGDAIHFNIITKVLFYQDNILVQFPLIEYDMVNTAYLKILCNIMLMNLFNV